MSEQIINPDQEKAILHSAGPAQIIAGPGSGKTFVTVHRILHLIMKQGVDPARILVITFTKAAALEMQERFFRLTQPERPPVRFGTFHAVFYHILKQSAHYRGYSIMTESEKRKQIRQLVHLHNHFACVREEDLEELIDSVGFCKMTGKVRPLSIEGIEEEDILFLVKEYESYQREFRQMDFDDIMLHCHRLLREDRELLGRWQEQSQYILVDEFQDISPLQYEIVRMLAAPQHNLFIVGDDDQSVYGFRGASPDSMQRFRRDYPAAAVVLLDRNYRCHKQITAAALRVIGENQHRIDKRICAVHEKGEGFRLLQCENEEEMRQTFVREIRERQRAGLLSNCAVICRTNYDCAMWAQVLRRHGIPFSMKERPGNRFRHFVVLDIMAYLELAEEMANVDAKRCSAGIRNPAVEASGYETDRCPYGTGISVGVSRKYFLRIMNRPVRYLKRDIVTEETVREEVLLACYRGSAILQERVRRLFQDIRNLRGRKLYLQIHYIRNIIGYDGYLREKYKGPKADELIRIAVQFQEVSRGFSSLQDMKEYIAGYEETLKDIQEQKQEKEDAVNLLTMHASKGLEFDSVYLPDCQEGKIPSAKAVTEEEIEEERRMFYVAMTRARHSLCLMTAKGRTGKDAPSRFLACLTDHVSSASPSSSSSNSAASRYSSKASATASYSSSSSI